VGFGVRTELAMGILADTLDEGGGHGSSRSLVTMTYGTGMQVAFRVTIFILFEGTIGDKFMGLVMRARFFLTDSGIGTGDDEIFH
jgi:hypothetical protein